MSNNINRNSIIENALRQSINEFKAKNGSYYRDNDPIFTKYDLDEIFFKIAAKEYALIMEYRECNSIVLTHKISIEIKDYIPGLRKPFYSSFFNGSEFNSDLALSTQMESKHTAYYEKWYSYKMSHFLDENPPYMSESELIKKYSIFTKNIFANRHPVFGYVPPEPTDVAESSAAAARRGANALEGPVFNQMLQGVHASRNKQEFLKRAMPSVRRAYLSEAKTFVKTTLIPFLESKVPMLSKVVGALGTVAAVAQLGQAIVKDIEAGNNHFKNTTAALLSIAGSFAGADLGAVAGAAGGPLGAFIGGCLGAAIGGAIGGGLAKVLQPAIDALFEMKKKGVLPKGDMTYTIFHQNVLTTLAKNPRSKSVSDGLDLQIHKLDYIFRPYSSL